MRVAPQHRLLVTLGVVSLAVMFGGCAVGLRPGTSQETAALAWRASQGGAALGLVVGLAVRARGWTMVLVVPTLTYLVVMLTS